MNPVIASITLRQLLSRRRTILLLLLGGVLVLVALIYRLAGDGRDDLNFTSGLLDNLGLAALMPLVALLFATSALGSELEDGTAVFILAKPVSRWSILVTKLAVASGCSLVVTCIPIAVAGLIGAGGTGDGLVAGYTVAAAFGTVVYCALFLFLSLVTGRALIIGLGYVLIWEGVLSGLFAGTRTFSVRQYSLALADAVADVPSNVLDAALDLRTALVMAVVIACAVTFLAGRRLARIEIAGEAA
ncbi:MAG TPA: ABC transporter permease subunit [Candidatus Limnocylindria bacterium]|nr:ABC transporter permease subunit [Candidatus Limnocylindria bacterium]